MTWASRRVFASRGRQAIRREGWRRASEAAAALDRMHVEYPDPEFYCPCVWCMAGRHQAECAECDGFWNPDPNDHDEHELCRVGLGIEWAIFTELEGL